MWMEKSDTNINDMEKDLALSGGEHLERKNALLDGVPGDYLILRGIT
jgi:hypothetical protein